jgi:hypothetical protein
MAHWLGPLTATESVKSRETFGWWTFSTLRAWHNFVSSYYKIMRSKRTYAFQPPKTHHLSLFLIAEIDLR